MLPDRRAILGFGLGLGTATAAAAAGRPRETKPVRTAIHRTAHDGVNDIAPNAAHDQTVALQGAIDRAAKTDVPLYLPAGTIRISDLRLRRGTRLIGEARRTVLQFSGGAAFITAAQADGIALHGIVFDGAYQTWDEARGEGLLSLAHGKDIVVEDVEIRNSARSGLALNACAGRVSHCIVSDVLAAGIKSLNARGLDIRANHITRCADNGVLIWRSEAGTDGTIVAANRIDSIRSVSGGSGEYGNGINVFRAGGVLVEGNRIADCAYSAVRGNAASNIQIIANNCQRLGEVALYCEFGFEGAVVANNIVDTAATGIAVTNFNEGGRLAVVQGNLVRNLFRREEEAEDQRGEGITVEADAVVSSNTVEGAPSVGIQIGWGPFMRNVAATGNVIRECRVGISVTDDPDAGACLIANNLISGTREGAIRHMSHGDLKGSDLLAEAPAAGRITVSGNVAA